jgi:hypothetical protein
MVAISLGIKTNISPPFTYLASATTLPSIDTTQQPNFRAHREERSSKNILPDHQRYCTLQLAPCSLHIRDKPSDQRAVPCSHQIRGTVPCSLQIRETVPCSLQHPLGQAICHPRSGEKVLVRRRGMDRLFPDIGHQLFKVCWLVDRYFPMMFPSLCSTFQKRDSTFKNSLVTAS